MLCTIVTNLQGVAVQKSGKTQETREIGRGEKPCADIRADVTSSPLLSQKAKLVSSLVSTSVKP